MLRPAITAMLRPTPLRSLVRRSASGHHQLPPGSRRSFAGGGGKAPDFDNMGASELRALVKELWRKSPQGSISAPSEVSRVTKGAALDAEKEQDSFKAMTIVELQKMRDQNIPISMVTAYDFPSAVHVDLAGIDVLLVGDSLGMVVLGYDTTLPVSFDEMLHHCQAVSRAVKRPLLVGDLPFGSYEISTQEAQHNAYRLVKEGNMEAVKLEGADDHRLRTVEVLVNGGIAVMGHIGLTPQSYSTLGGFRAQGRHARQAVELIHQARRLETAGVFGMVLECVPDEVAKEISAAVSVPTIGIGAGPHTSGQVLVYHDLLGMMQHPHHAKAAPKFCKSYASVGVSINNALRSFRQEVRNGEFPCAKYSPYKMAAGERQVFRDLLASSGASGASLSSSSAAPSTHPRTDAAGSAGPDTDDAPIQVY